MTTPRRPNARPNADRLIVLNCGMGRDSLTMLVLAIEGKLVVELEHGPATLGAGDIDAVVFSDTGCEWPGTYALLDDVAVLADMLCAPLIVLDKGDGDDAAVLAAAASRPADMAGVLAKAASGAYHASARSGNRRLAIMADLALRATVASLGKGDCTDNHKIQPIRRLLSDLSRVRFGLDNRAYGAAVRRGERAPHVCLVGYTAGEQSRVEGSEGHKSPDYVTERFPLVTMGITKDLEAPILKSWGLGHVRKSGCYMCPYQPPSWYWALSVTEPGKYQDVVAYEARALARNPRMNVTGIKAPKRDGARPLTLPEVVARWRERNPEATVDAVLDKQYTRCTKEARAERRADAAALNDGKRRLPMVEAA